MYSEVLIKNLHELRNKKKSNIGQIITFQKSIRRCLLIALPRRPKRYQIHDIIKLLVD